MKVGVIHTGGSMQELEYPTAREIAESQRRERQLAELRSRITELEAENQRLRELAGEGDCSQDQGTV